MLGTRPTRRWTLACLAAAGLFILAGCAGVIGGTAEDPRLGGVEIRNHDDEPHEVEVVVEKDGEVVHETTRRVAGRQDGSVESVVVDLSQFADEPGEYVIYAHLGNASSGERFSLADVADDGCFVVQIRIDADASITFFKTEGAYECDA